MADWDGDSRFWSVQDGAITGITTKETPTPRNTFIIWRGGVLKDFELQVAWRLENHNSGIQYRSKDRGKWVVNGYQADMDGSGTIKLKDWNQYAVIGRGNHLVQKINGIVTVDVTDEDEKRRAMEGILAFQLHAGGPMKVQFKDIRLQVLSIV